MVGDEDEDEKEELYEKEKVELTLPIENYDEDLCVNTEFITDFEPELILEII